jgi:hypothetical protein
MTFDEWLRKEGMNAKDFASIGMVRMRYIWNEAQKAVADENNFSTVKIWSEKELSDPWDD